MLEAKKESIIKKYAKLIKLRWSERFFTREVQLYYDASNGEYGLRAVYRSLIPMDKFGYRLHAHTIPVKALKIKHSDFIKIADSIDRFLSTHERIGEGLVK